MAFTTLVVGQLVYVFQCRSEQHRMWELGLWDNPLAGRCGARICLNAARGLIRSFASAHLQYGAFDNRAVGGCAVLFGVCGIAGDIAAAVHGS